MANESMIAAITARITERAKELKSQYDCTACKSCYFRRCELAINLSTEALLQRNTEKRRAEREWHDTLRRDTLPADMIASLGLDDMLEHVAGNA